MTTVKAILTKPLDGQPEGAEREFDKVDFDRLKEMGAVRAAGEAKAAPAPLNKAAPPVENKAAAADVTRAAKSKP